MFDRSNLVHRIGYGFERIHTGILAWLLHFEGTGPDTLQRALLGALCADDERFLAGVVSCEPEREVRMGRSRADLVLRLTAASGEPRCIVVEAKVDTDIRVEQLVRMREATDAWDGPPPSNCRFVVLALGAARFTWSSRVGSDNGEAWPAYEGEQASEWTCVGPQQLTCALAAASGSAADDPLLRDWRAAIEDELELRCAPRFLHGREHEVRKLGHSRWYAPYDRLRAEIAVAASEGGAAAGDLLLWIYNTANNAVLNDWPSPRSPAGEFDIGPQLYWELGDGTFFLKAYWKARAGPFPEELGRIADRVLDKLSGDNGPGCVATGRRSSKHGYWSLVKWHGFLDPSRFADPGYWAERAGRYLEIRRHGNVAAGVVDG